MSNQSGREVSFIDGVKHVKMACKAGHDWWRVSQKGKPPHWCDEHKPVVAEPTVKAKMRAHNEAVQVLGTTVEVPTSLAEKRKADMAEVEGPKPIKQLEAEREAELARERAKAEKELANIDTLIIVADGIAETKCAANLKAMDAISDKKPETLRAQDSTYRQALRACAEVSRLKARKASLEQAAA